MLKRKTISFIGFVTLAIILSGCFTILLVTQPGAGMVGEAILVEIEVQLVDEDANEKCGIVGIMLPTSWVVDSVYFTGDVGPDYCIFLHPDSVDCTPGGQMDFWADTLERRYPSGPDMEWRVYQSSQGWNKPSGTPDWFVDLFIEMTIGDQNGDFDLSYFVSNSGLDFTDSTWFDIDEGNTIRVTGGTDVKDKGIVAKTYGLEQNYPNPFNPSTTITFSIPESGNVKLTVFNSLGEEVTILVDEFLPSGVKTVKFEDVSIYSGIYY
jgi:uncharacterized protein YceK